MTGIAAVIAVIVIVAGAAWGFRREFGEGLHDLIRWARAARDAAVRHGHRVPATRGHCRPVERRVGAPRGICIGRQPADRPYDWALEVEAAWPPARPPVLDSGDPTHAAELRQLVEARAARRISHHTLFGGGDD